MHKIYIYLKKPHYLTTKVLLQNKKVRFPEVFDDLYETMCWT